MRILTESEIKQKIQEAKENNDWGAIENLADGEFRHHVTEEIIEEYKTKNFYEAMLKHLIKLSRQSGYATQDESWGEFEKEFSIIFRKCCQLEKLIDILKKGTHIDLRNYLVHVGEYYE